MGLLSFIVKKAAASLKEEEEEELRKKHTSILSERWDEIVKMLVGGITINEVASHFFTEFQIPPIRTILLLSKSIKEWADSDDQELNELAFYVISKQHVDVEASPLSYIQQFNDSNSVFGATGCKAYQAKNNLSKEEGIILLSKPYIYYFPIPADKLARKEFSITKERIKSRLSDGVEQIFPGLEVLGLGWDVFEGINDAYKDFFDDDRKKILESLISSGDGVAISIYAIKRLRSFQDDNKNNFLHIRFTHTSGALEENVQEDIYFRPTDDKDADKVDEWIKSWESLITTAAVAKGVYFRKKT